MSDWWSKKLGTPQVPQPRPVNNPMPPSQQPMTPYTPPQPIQETPKAQSANQQALCPNCGSTNFMSVSSAAPRCFDCGYPQEQSGSKYGQLQGAKVEGSAKPAFGSSNNPTSNWNPQGIIGRIE